MLSDNFSHNDFHSTLDNLMEGFQIIDFDWKYVYVNEAVIKQSKFSKEELLGFTMMERYPGVEKSAMFETLKRCMYQRIATNFENEFTFPDGTKGWFELRVQPVPEGIFILSVDITERKKAENERLEYIKALEEMVFMTSHRIRQPITQILGVSYLLDQPDTTQEEIKKITGYMKQSVSSLDTFTHELTSFIYNLQVKAGILKS